MRSPFLALMVCTAALAGAVQVYAEGTSAALPCDSELSLTTSAIRELSDRLERQLERRVRKAVTLYRFHRGEEAVARLDELLGAVGGSWGVRIDDKPREALTTAVQGLRKCLAETAPLPLATLTVRTFEEDETAAEYRGGAAPGGAFVKVEEQSVGQTGSDGALTVKVPSGPISVRVTEYPSSFGAEEVTLAPGDTGTIDIVLASSKEPSEDTDLVIAEAVDGILPLKSGTLTLTFVDDGTAAAMKEVERIELRDLRGAALEDLTPLFKVADGAIVTTDPAAVYRRIGASAWPQPAMQVAADAIDTQGRTHAGVVAFHAGQSKLSVTLAAPPSNPGLAVASIPVRVSVPGNDVAVVRVSDADGHFEIESLPETTVMLDAATKADGRHYYSHGIMMHSGDCSVMLFLLHVTDLVNGARQLVRDGGCPTAKPLPRER